MLDRATQAPIRGDGALRTAGVEAGNSPTIVLRVIGGFDLRVREESVPVGRSCQRLLALLAVKGGKINRTRAAGMLWPEVVRERALANLRSTLWRVQRGCEGVVDASFYDLRLSASVAVDIAEVHEVARRLLDRSSLMDTAALKRATRCNLYEDIAPDLGDEDWLAAERERFLQLRVHSLEVLSEHLISAGWYGAAVEAALGAIHSDPFRECAYSLLIRAYLAEGSYLEAQRQYQAYCQLLRRELHLDPSPEFMSLLDSYGQSTGDDRHACAERSGRGA